MVTRNWIILLPLIVWLSGCSTVTRFSNPNASGYRQIEREECVPYARRVSGIQLRGDAYTWWDKAAGIYMRGAQPMPGAILVLSKTNRLRHGHLAVVTNLITPREITVTHTNWGNDWMSRRVTYESLRVQDVSMANDWSSVRFWNNEENVFGFPYQVSGFIYNVRI
jgi:hypothetical protein